MIADQDAWRYALERGDSLRPITAACLPQAIAALRFVRALEAGIAIQPDQGMSERPAAPAPPATNIPRPRRIEDDDASGQ